MNNPNLIEVYECPSVLLSSSIRVVPGMRPRRVVLREIPGQFVTHVEYLRLDVTVVHREGKKYDVVLFSNDGFEHGHYFAERQLGTREKALRQANDDFNVRVRDMEGSIARVLISTKVQESVDLR